MMYIHQSKHKLMKKDTVPRPCACTSVRKAARVLARTYAAALAPSGMNVTQLAVMRAVLRHPGEPLSRVAADLAMDRTSLYRALGALHEQHWVRLDGGKDNRSRRASITKKGDAVLAQADLGWASTQTAVVDRFGREQWHTFVAELQRLAECATSIAISKFVPGEIR
jgi:DNA-binding MarR family transcriptional regulator